MRIWPILATHALVAWCAWLNGWLSGVWAERRRREDVAWPARPISIIDLTTVRPYDWQRDGECVREALR